MGPVLWAVNATIAVIVLAWVASVPMAIDWPSLGTPAAGSAGLMALALLYRRSGRNERIAVTLETLAQIVAFMMVGELLSYLLASAGGPLWDARLYAADRALGLDWRAYLALVDARPWLGATFNVAYLSILPQVLIVILLLGLSGRIAALQGFAGAFVLSGIVCMVVSALMPAFANFVYLGLSPADFPNLDPAAAFVHVETLEALRSGAMTTLSLRDAEGIITFPSYHASLAVIFALALWEMRAVRWIAVPLNALMLLATPIDGGHYFVDVFAGIAIALVAWFAARAVAAYETAPHLAIRGRLFVSR